MRGAGRRCSRNGAIVVCGVRAGRCDPRVSSGGNAHAYRCEAIFHTNAHTRGGSRIHRSREQGVGWLQ